MALPKINHPTFTVVLPSTGKEVQIRPFTVKEEKLLLIANASKEFKDVFNAIRQVIVNCVVTEDFNIENCALFDIEYLFIQLRSKSVNNIIEVTLTDPDDQKEYNIKVDLDTVKVNKDNLTDKKIMFDDTSGMILKYPSYSSLDVLKNISKDLTEDEIADIVYKIYAECIETIFNDDKIYTKKDFSQEEAVEYLNSIPLKNFEKVKDFFNNTPKIEHKITYTNSLGSEKTFTLSGINDFFT
jgi:hypothetical protein